ncbi:NUDIX hydrolase [Pseudonocardia sp. HH130630-07]|uniref:NUDIX hydrolase n=1 Tax=Pseudonocardia sp. HH130630-07 TaxID=1690815 RepID=UPI000814C808|nr:NUDIX domain-containing protein [Pseudonocardia sp. HH130630-07]ANY05562.1 NUDIX hydrolase [Pseudonocardia sp. HH130630-07]
MAGTPQHSVSVAGIVVREDGRVLAIQRRDNAHWEPPGGVLELAETFEQGVCREVAEETGIRVEAERLTGAYKNLPRGVVALVFRCRVLGGEPTATDESLRVDWLTPDEVREYMDPAYAVRVLDALTDTPASRAHDGVQLVAT